MTATGTMTSDAKRKLSQTIRELRAYLLEKLEADLKSLYRFDIKRAEDAALDERRTIERRRFEAWAAEQVRAEGAASKGAKKKKGGRTAADFRQEAVKQAAYTLLNRLVFLKLLEAPRADGRALRSPVVVTGGWDSRGYRDFRELAPALVKDDPSEGYGFLLKLVFEDLAQDLPGLYGPAGIAELVPVGPAVLRRLIEALDDPALAACWTDDMTLGWVYQYWNDPEREALDAKINDGGQGRAARDRQQDADVHRALHGRLAAPEQPGPDVAGHVREARLDAGGRGRRRSGAAGERRADWRAKREAGEVALDRADAARHELERALGVLRAAAHPRRLRWSMRTGACAS